MAGVVGDVQYEGLDTPSRFEAYLPIGLFPQSAITLLIKTSSSPATIIVDVRSRILGINRGATPRAVVRLMRRRSVIPVAAGAAIGLVVMMATARLLSAMLFETGPLDPMTFIGATVLFVLVAPIAASVPARRATKVDPLVAVRCE